MANFKGFKQVSLAAYNGYSDEEKKNYLWLVRDLSGETVLSAAIYFGTRKYAELNDDAASEAKVENIVSSLGNIVDENGEWVGFLPFDEHELLGNTGVTSLEDALSVLEAAILENADAIAGKVSESVYNEKVAELEGAITSLEEQIGEVSEGAISALTAEVETINQELEGKANKAEVETLGDKVNEVDGKVDAVSDKADELEQSLSAVTQMLDEKADASDVYTKDEVYSKEEVDAKVAGVFHFVGTADGISADETTIFYDGQNIEASDGNTGDVYQIGDKEYASNGEKWVELGFNIDLSDFATKEFVESAMTAEAAQREALEDRVATAEEAIAQEIQERQALADEVEEVRNASTTTASTFSDAEEMDLQLGQIIYIVNEETVSGITYIPGAYIYTQDGLKKLDSTTPSTSTTVEQRVESLENTVGGINSLIGNDSFEGASITEAIAALQQDNTHIIEGDDVEE